MMLLTYDFLAEEKKEDPVLGSLIEISTGFVVGWTSWENFESLGII
jgi:hypothetical protein